MKLKLFQSTVLEYMRFTQQLPINYYDTTTDCISDSKYVAAQTRLMLLRKYTHKGRGNLHLPDIVNAAIKSFPNDKKYLSELENNFKRTCEDSLTHILTDGTSQTLEETIDDTIYGLHLHADHDRILRILQGDEKLRLYCVVTFVKQMEELLFELSKFLSEKGVSHIEKPQYSCSPVINFEPNNAGSQKVKASPYWGNLTGFDVDEESCEELWASTFEQWSTDELKIYLTAYVFTQLLLEEPFSYDKMRKVIYEPAIDDWGDFIDAINWYKSIQSPALSTKIRFSEDNDEAYVYVIPNVKGAFVVEAKQLLPDISKIMLVKDEEKDEWRVFSCQGPS